MQNCFGKFAQLNINKMKIAMEMTTPVPNIKKAIMDMLKAKGYEVIMEPIQLIV
jgi:hypothetical protein